MDVVIQFYFDPVYFKIVRFALFGALVILSGCSGLLSDFNYLMNGISQTITDYERAQDNYCEVFDDTLLHDKPRSKGVEISLKRAQQLARLKWLPHDNISRVGYGGQYLANKEYIGVPYSLVMHVNTYVGLDISLYTFLTAVANPYSVLYSENVRKPPYNGVQCAPYYGTVCSTAVWYALGIYIPYFTRFVPTLDFLTTPDYSTPDAIELCDILLSEGHMVMVYDIGRGRDGYIEKVTLFECGVTFVEDTKFIIYTFEEFKERWENVKWKIFRYNGLDDNIDFDDYDFVSIDNYDAAPFIYDKSLCTNRGDKVAYREGEDVVINIFDTIYSNIEIYKDGVLLKSFSINDNCIVLSSLPYGDYKVRLASKERQYSDFIYFEVLDINVDVKFDGMITTYFHSLNAHPEYMDICTSSQSPQAYYPFSNDDIYAQEITVDTVVKDVPLFCKVYFRGKYGRVSNIPIAIN